MAELKSDFFNKEEVRTHDSRLSYINTFLPKLLKTAKEKTLGFKDHLESIDPNEVRCIEDLQKIPVLRKSELKQKNCFLHLEVLKGLKNRKLRIFSNHQVPFMNQVLED